MDTESQWNLLNHKEGQLRELAREQPDASRVEFERRCTFAEAILRASIRLWEKRAKVEAALQAHLHGKRLKVITAFAVVGLLIHFLRVEPRFSDFGMLIFYGSLVAGFSFVQQQNKLIRSLEQVAAREDDLLTQWSSTGASAENFWLLRRISANQRMSDSQGADTGAWGEMQALEDHDIRNVWLNSQYTMLCLCRLTGHFSKDHWSYEMPKQEDAERIVEAP